MPASQCSGPSAGTRCDLCGQHGHDQGACHWSEDLRPEQRYEAEKHVWCVAHPEAGPVEREAAMHAIAEKVGI